MPIRSNSSATPYSRLSFLICSSCSAAALTETPHDTRTWDTTTAAHLSNSLASTPSWICGEDIAEPIMKAWAFFSGAIVVCATTELWRAGRQFELSATRSRPRAYALDTTTSTSATCTPESRPQIGQKG
jgi:hypothetical protein